VFQHADLAHVRLAHALRRRRGRQPVLPLPAPR
jgi:hypothetical protein